MNKLPEAALKSQFLASLTVDVSASNASPQENASSSMQALRESLEREGIYSIRVEQPDPGTIKPRIMRCDLRAHHKVFSLCKSTQSVKSSNRVGRRLRYILVDDATGGPYLMGAMELASSPYTLSARDKYLSWPSHGGQKDVGLRNVMDLSTVVGIGVYSRLRFCKFAAAMAHSRTVKQDFKNKYGQQLLGVVATSANGIHSASLNRIMLKSGGLYRRIGSTTGFTTVNISPATLALARQFVPGYQSPPLGHFGPSVRAIAVLRQALRACGVGDGLIAQAAPKGVYFSVASNESLDTLRGIADERDCDGFDDQQIIEYWRLHQVNRLLNTHRASNDNHSV